MEWVSVKNSLPEELDEVLVTDGETSWVAFCIKFHETYTWLGHHPDYKRTFNGERNGFGCPYSTLSEPTHWMPLPLPPENSPKTYCGTLPDHPTSLRSTEFPEG